MDYSNILVVDFNVLFSAVISKGNSLSVFIENFRKKRFEFIAPQFLLIEFGNNSQRIAGKTKLSLQETLEMTEFVISQIKFIQDKYFEDKLQEAKSILKDHEKDIPYLALALKNSCLILSGDKTLKEFCPSKVKSPREILTELL